MRRSVLFVLLSLLSLALFALKPSVDVAPNKARATDNPVAALAKEAQKAADHGDHQRAIELCTKALADDNVTEDERRDLLRRRGSAHEWARHYDAAEADFNAALAIKPVSADVYFRRGYFYERRKRYEEALSDFAAGKRLNPLDAWFDFGEGEIYAARGDHPAAIAHFSEAIRLNPKMVRAYLERGSEYNYESRFAEAQADYDKVLADDMAQRLLPRRMIGLAYLGRGYASLHLEEYRRAREDFDKALAIAPRWPDALAWRGGAFHGLGDRERAIADYKAALSLDPNNRYAKINLGDLEKP
jgi:tetratricopeptide (TPR) repeat protein